MVRLNSRHNTDVNKLQHNNGIIVYGIIVYGIIVYGIIVYGITARCAILYYGARNITVPVNMVSLHGFMQRHLPAFLVSHFVGKPSTMEANEWL
jgi:hypothetical protein